jgi:hypothetical protein
MLAELFERVRLAGITLRVEGDRLAVLGPEDAVERLLPELLAAKAEIMAALATRTHHALVINGTPFFACPHGEPVCNFCANVVTTFEMFKDLLEEH